MQVLSLEASLSAVHSERSQSDIGLKSRMQELLSELQSTLQVRLPGCSCSHAWYGCLGCRALSRYPCKAVAAMLTHSFSQCMQACVHTSLGGLVCHAAPCTAQVQVRKPGRTDLI